MSFNSLARGGLIDESHALLTRWDFALKSAQNFKRAIDENYLGVSSSSHLVDIVGALRRRLDPEGRERPLAILAKAGVSSDVFRACLLWHLTLDEFLLRDFLLNWLFPAFEGGPAAIQTQDLDPFIRTIRERGADVRAVWTATTQRRAATSLLKIATDFGLLSTGTPKRFERFVLSDDAFLYLLQGLVERTGSSGAAVRSADWRMFLMRPVDVEQELLRLHQYRKLEYQVAGSLVQLSLPCTSLREYAERMVA